MKVLLRLNHTNPINDLQKTIDEFKQSPLDPNAEKRIDDTIKQWKEMEKCLEHDLNLVKSDLLGVKTEMREVQKTTKDTQERLSRVEKLIAPTEENNTLKSKKGNLYWLTL